jgi:hypothetical protein
VAKPESLATCFLEQIQSGVKSPKLLALLWENSGFRITSPAMEDKSCTCIPPGGSHNLIVNAVRQGGISNPIFPRRQPVITPKSSSVQRHRGCPAVPPILHHALQDLAAMQPIVIITCFFFPFASAYCSQDGRFPTCKS